MAILTTATSTRVDLEEHEGVGRGDRHRPHEAGQPPPALQPEAEQQRGSEYEQRQLLLPRRHRETLGRLVGVRGGARGMKLGLGLGLGLGLRLGLG